MFENFKTQHPDRATLASSITLGILSYVFLPFLTQDITATDLSVLQRSLFITALYLLMSDVIQGAQIAFSHKPSLRSANFWHLAFAHGYTWGVAMILVFWETSSEFSALLIRWGIAAIVFGIFMAWSARNRGEEVIAPLNYELDRPVTDRFGGALYHIWPIVVLGIMIALAFGAPTDGWLARWLAFLLVLLGSLLPLYPRHKWYENTPRLLGIGPLLIGVLVV